MGHVQKNKRFNQKLLVPLAQQHASTRIIRDKVKGGGVYCRNSTIGVVATPCMV